MSILRHVVGIACELLTIKDPYDYQPSERDTRRDTSPRIVSNTHEMDGTVLVKYGNSSSWSVMSEESARRLPNVIDER